MPHTQGRQADAGLAEQFLAMHQDADPVAAAGGLFGDVAEDHGFAAAGGEDKQHGAVAGLVRLTDFGDGLVLVGAEVHAHSSLRSWI
jgi:hypothetical protein